MPKKKIKERQIRQAFDVPVGVRCRLVEDDGTKSEQIYVFNGYNKDRGLYELAAVAGQCSGFRMIGRDQLLEVGLEYPDKMQTQAELEAEMRKRNCRGCKWLGEAFGTGHDGTGYCTEIEKSKTYKRGENDRCRWPLSQRCERYEKGRYEKRYWPGKER